MKVPIMIIDDHEIFRNGLRNLINNTSWATCCGEASSIETSLDLIKKNKPQILLLDLYINGRRSFEDIPKLRKSSPSTKIVMLTVSEDEEDVYEATQQGVEGYILKDTPFSKLEAYLIDINNGSIIMSESLASVLFKEVMKINMIKPLSNRENEVLSLVAKGYSNKDIANTLCISVYTVKNHISNLMKKMNVKNRSQLALSFLKYNAR
ncbi:MAG TPA: response regulator transcription factor [Firmicutes bacterium]|jgi:DNA-binding NarL/FixJ family response regulator|nr:response regulator transcription factor [Bacillota bacterium]